VAPSRGVRRHVTSRVVGLCALAALLIAVYALGRLADPWAFAGLALGCLAVAGVSGYALGWDLSRDLDLLVDHVRALAAGPPALTAGAAPPVLSPDEIGDLQAALAHLYKRLWEDVETQRRALVATESADRERDVYLAGVGEAIRAPLLAIDALGRDLLAGRHGPLPDAQRDDVDVVVRGSEQLLDLLEDVVAVAAARRTGVHLRVADVDAEKLVRDVVRACEPLVRDRPLALRIDVAPGVPELRADERRLRQVLHNLVGNAIKFTERGEVAVAVSCDDSERVSIRVSDTGPGIDASDLGRIFDDFGQSGPEHSRRRGAGLGLSISRRLVELHGGTLDVASTLGAGSAFTIRFPRSR
jgi:signal transduction histidine kinase